MPNHVADVHVQVLWHTAAAISENLVQAAGLPAKMLCEQTAELAADRLRRQQRMIPVPAQHEPTSGADASIADRPGPWLDHSAVHCLPETLHLNYTHVTATTPAG